MTGSLIDDLHNAASASEALVTHRAERLRVGCERLLLAAHWCDLHPEDTGPGSRPGRQVGSEGTPRVAEFTAEQLSCLLEVHPQAAHVLMADALNLRHHHPLLWSKIEALEVTDWVAAKTARLVAAAELTPEQARWVDSETAPFITTLPVGRYLALVEAKIIEADEAAAEARREAEMRARFVRKTRTNEHGIRGLYARATFGEVNYFYAVIDRIAQILALQGDSDPVDVRRSKALVILAVPQRAMELFAWAEQHTGHLDLGTATDDDLVKAAENLPAPPLSSAPKPPATINVHVSAEAIAAGLGVARVEGVGPIALAAIRDLLGHTAVTVRPVLDLTKSRPVDGYEVPGWLRELVELRFPFEVFPFGTVESRKADKDHSIPYLPRAEGGLPGQTRADNLAPLGRRAHRVKTFGPGWRHLRVGPRTFLWRTPTGSWYRVDPDGTHSLGTTMSLPEEQLRDLLRAA